MPVRRAEELDVLGGRSEKVAGLYAVKMTRTELLALTSSLIRHKITDVIALNQELYRYFCILLQLSVLPIMLSIRSVCM